MSEDKDSLRNMSSAERRGRTKSEDSFSAGITQFGFKPAVVTSKLCMDNFVDPTYSQQYEEALMHGSASSSTRPWEVDDHSSLSGAGPAAIPSVPSMMLADSPRSKRKAMRTTSLEKLIEAEAAAIPPPAYDEEPPRSGRRLSVHGGLSPGSLGVPEPTPGDGSNWLDEAFDARNGEKSDPVVSPALARSTVDEKMPKRNKSIGSMLFKRAGNKKEREGTTTPRSSDDMPPELPPRDELPALSPAHRSPMSPNLASPLASFSPSSGSGSAGAGAAGSDSQSSERSDDPTQRRPSNGTQQPRAKRLSGGGLGGLSVRIPGETAGTGSPCSPASSGRRAKAMEITEVPDPTYDTQYRLDEQAEGDEATGELEDGVDPRWRTGGSACRPSALGSASAAMPRHMSDSATKGKFKPIDSPGRKANSRLAGSAVQLFVSPEGPPEESSDAVPGVFEEPDSPENIIFNDEPPKMSLRGGTLPKLVQHLTSDKNMDTDLVIEFLLTHRGFTSSEGVLDLLHERYKVRRPKDMDDTEFQKTRLFPIRLRCVNVLKTWITLRPEDFMDNPNLTKKANEFISYFEQHTVTAKNLKRLLDKAVSADWEQKTETQQAPPPDPLVYEDTFTRDRITLDDLHPEEIARQLWLMEFKLWKAIRPHEFMNKAWMTRDKERRAPHIIGMAKASTHVTNWVVSEILAHADIRARAQTLFKFIQVAERSLALNNYNAVMEIFAALQSSSVHRLRRTWELLPPRGWDVYDALSIVVNSDGNFAAYRDRLRSCLQNGTPVVPYLGLYLTFLTFIHDGNPNTIPGTKLINFNKWRAVSEVIKEILTLQGHQLNFKTVGFAQTYIATQNPMSSEEAQFERSQELEETRKNKLTKEERAAVDKLSKEIFRQEHRPLRKAVLDKDLAALDMKRSPASRCYYSPLVPDSASLSPPPPPE